MLSEPPDADPATEEPKDDTTRSAVGATPQKVSKSFLFHEISGSGHVIQLIDLTR
jgi:hypothetical protein